METQAIAEELTRLADLNGGMLSPDKVVQVAADPASVLHPFFQWDDDAAAHLYRIAQARGLIRRIRVQVAVESRGARRLNVTVEHAPREPRSVRLFQSPRSSRGAGGGYQQVGAILEDDETNDSMVDTFRVELFALTRRISSFIDAAHASGNEETATKLQIVVEELTDLLAREFPPPEPLQMPQQEGDGKTATAG